MSNERISVTRHVEFEAAHLLSGYDGRCGSLHGHSYSLEVTVSCSKQERVSNDFNFVMDFKKLDRILDDYVPDHCFITNISNGEDTPEGQIARIAENNGMRIFKMTNPPSAENMSELFAIDLQIILNNEFKDKDYTIDEVKLWETTNSHSTWRKSE